jgi:predicted ATP-binding protein involved in virulence
MHLKKITLKNFRCFEKFELELHSQLTVIVAQNAGGKTAVLDAIAKGLSSWCNHFSSADQRLSGVGLTDDDLRVTVQEGKRGKITSRRADYASVTCAMDWGRAQINWEITHARTPEIREAHPGDESQLKNEAVSIREAIYHDEPGITLPVFAYYGVHRGHVTQEVKERVHPPKVDYTQRLAALVDALAPDLREFSEIVSWFKDAALDELTWEKEHTGENRMPGDTAVYDGVLPHVREAFTAVLEDRVTNPRMDRQSKKFTVDFRTDNGSIVPLRFEQLSQGYASVLAMVLDFAQRLAVANPYFLSEEDYRQGAVFEKDGHPLEAPAIMLIDEIDLHLHPSWQQRVLDDLIRAFPGTQFIVTTHSPQVLTTVKRESIRILAQDADGAWTASLPTEETKGDESATVLAAVMGVDPVPQVPEAAELSRYRQMIQLRQQESDDGKKLRQKLDAHFGPRHHLMLDCDRMIRLAQFKAKLPIPSHGSAE